MNCKQGDRAFIIRGGSSNYGRLVLVGTLIGDLASGTWWTDPQDGTRWRVGNNAGGPVWMVGADDGRPLQVTAKLMYEDGSIGQDTIPRYSMPVPDRYLRPLPPLPAEINPYDEATPQGFNRDAVLAIAHDELVKKGMKAGHWATHAMAAKIMERALPQIRRAP